MRHLVLVMLVLVGGTAEAKPRPKAKAPAAKTAKTPKAARTIDTASAKLLGEAYAAYDQNDLSEAKKLLQKLDDKKLANVDYALWLRGMVALRTGVPATAKLAFEKLAKLGNSRFARLAPWRLADCAWEAGDKAGAAKQYARLINADKASELGDVGTAKFRIAEAAGTAGKYRDFVLDHPGHPLAERAEKKMLELGGPPFTPGDRISRAKMLTAAHLWDHAVAELALIPKAELAGPLQTQHDYWLGTTLFQMRRRYADAAQLLLGVYQRLDSAEAMFHGARALSRADKDDEAIVWYKKVVATYPRTSWAEEAQYLSGWLEFNRGKYKESVGPLEETIRRYPKSKWVDDALWFSGMAHYFLGEYDAARAPLARLAKFGSALEGGKGRYWLARIDEKLKRKDDAIEGYRDTIARHPFSWYALLAHSRLETLGVKVNPFGVEDPKVKGPAFSAEVDESLAADDLIERVDELIAAGLPTDAGEELSRGERPFLKRNEHKKAFAMLLDRYRKAGNFNRPWVLAVSYGGTALNGPPRDDAKRWWENAYPRAYADLVEKHQAVGKNPDHYLLSIMRKESGFDPHVVSYADAQGLLQMIPATSLRVSKELGVPYDPGKLYEPDYNIKLGSWYIGRLLQKFKGQIPFGAGSFNSGPRPVMKWLDQYGDREVDELVELVPFTQTREYMKKVTENYARYRYLYANEVYMQPLVVDKKYETNQLTY